MVVFDGHGGHECSHYASARYPVLFVNAITEEGATPRTALEKSIQTLNVETNHLDPGSTMSAVFIPASGEVAYCAVLGDSPIIIKDAEGNINIGPDHNVRTNYAERLAAEARGGFVSGGYLHQSYDGMGLQMARALGDNYLNKVLSRVPEIYEVSLNAESFVLVASDGAFDPGHYDFKNVAEAVVKLIEKGADAQAIVDQAVKVPTGDNVSVIVARFEND